MRSESICQYNRILVPAKDSADGETSTEVSVVEFPAVGFALLYESGELGRVVLATDYHRDPLINLAVTLHPDSLTEVAKSIDGHSRALQVTKHLDLSRRV